MRTELDRAGLPAAIGFSSDHAGAVVEVGPGDDAAGGVFVTWQPAAELHQLRMDAVERGHLDHPSIERAGRIAEAMLVAITAILRLAGIDAADADDDMRPIALRVSRPVAG